MVSVVIDVAHLGPSGLHCDNEHIRLGLKLGTHVRKCFLTLYPFRVVTGGENVVPFSISDCSKCTPFTWCLPQCQEKYHFQDYFWKEHPLLPIFEQPAPCKKKQPFTRFCCRTCVPTSRPSAPPPGIWRMGAEIVNGCSFRLWASSSMYSLNVLHYCRIRIHWL
jgi:hypothetical protein